MHISFCADPLAPRAVDDAYTDEAQAAMGSGLEYHLISYEQLVHQHDAAATVRRVPAAASSELALYRGWVLRPSEYQELYDALLARGLLLINSPAAYRTCHYLPDSYPLISDGDFPSNLRFLPGVDSVLIYGRDELPDYDMLCLIDCADRYREHRAVNGHALRTGQWRSRECAPT